MSVFAQLPAGGGQAWKKAIVPNIWRLRDTRGDKVEERQHFLQCVCYPGPLQPGEGKETCPHGASPQMWQDPQQGDRGAAHLGSGVHQVQVMKT